MTNSSQEIFDKVATHLLTQKEKSTQELSTGTRCVYRSPKGLKCAVGCLIPDELYNPSLEGYTASGLSYEIKIAIGYNDKTALLICMLQSMHDSMPPEKWKDLLRIEANTRGLSDKVLDAF